MNSVVEDPIALPVQSAYSCRFLMSISLNVYVVIVLISPRFPSFLLSTLIPPLPPFLTHVRLAPIRNHTSATQTCRFRGSAQGGAVGTFPPQHGGFVVIPIAFAEVEAAVFGPEEKPDADQDEGDAKEGEEGEEGAIVDVRGFDGAGARVVVWVLGGFVGVSGFEVGCCFEG